MNANCWALAMLSLLSGCLGTRPLLTENFTRDPTRAGWQYQVPRLTADREGEFVPWCPPTQPDGGVIGVNQGHWVGPALPVTPHRFYKVQFRVKAPAGGWWAASCYAGNEMMAADQYSAYDPSPDWQDYRCYTRGREGATHLRLTFRTDGRPAWFDDVLVEPASPREVRTWMAAQCATAPPLAWRPPRGHLDRLPRTVARLRAGEPLRIVMLGDSIINDTANSQWDLLLAGAWPRAQITLVQSVRGGGGCEFYQQPGNVQKYVLDYHPDLVIIGGISNGYSAAPVEDVIRQIRAGSPTEIMLMTGAVAPPATIAQAQLRSPELVVRLIARYGQELSQAAERNQLAFLDLRQVWDEYVKSSGQPETWFMRDRIHANDRGRAALARMLVTWFMPD